MLRMTPFPMGEHETGVSVSASAWTATQYVWPPLLRTLAVADYGGIVSGSLLVQKNSLCERPDRFFILVCIGHRLHGVLRRAKTCGPDHTGIVNIQIMPAAEGKCGGGCGAWPYSG